jgi:hypothetical protein
MRRLLAATVVGAAFLATATVASGGHGVEELTFDHTEVAAGPTVPGGPEVNSDPVGAWHRVATIATGNPHTDLDFFTQRGEIYAAVGTLAVGANGGGQTIVKLTQDGQVVEDPLSAGKPHFVSAHGSAACFSEPTQALGLQHDVEATPKGNAILNTTWPFAVRKDAQLLIDATDNPGRCHDHGPLASLVGAPQGGLEIIDITDINNPVEIGLVSHIGEAHTVNVDPKRPWIAYAVTSDAVGVEKMPDGSFKRRNEVHGSDQNDLDGFEVVDLSSCMNFPMGTDLLEKRARCRPKVYRYRYPTAEMALGHTLQTGANAIFGCHELEVYPNDRLTCGSGNAAMYFDMSGAFDRNGKPRGTPLPCRVRDSTSTAPFRTGAKVTDCVVGEGNQDLSVPGWLAMNPRPSINGVRWIGSAHHMGRGAGGTITTYDATQDIDFDHELELSASRRFLIATDERGGGVSPPGAACTTSDDFPTDNPQGNGGVHFYRVDRLDTTLPSSAAEAWEAYARTPSGEKAIHRAPIWTQPQGTLCTAHVFHQIPGQNRIFMGWYSQGTQVIDFVEHRNGTVSFIQRGRFIPSNANEWVSAVFKVRRNSNGTYTYWGATGDFNLAAAGRSVIDIFRVTLPAPPEPLGGDDGDGDGDCPSNVDTDSDGLIDVNETLLGTLLGIRDSDLDGIVDGNDDANGNGGADEDEDDHDGCPDRDTDGDGVDDEDEDD